MNSYDHVQAVHQSLRSRIAEPLPHASPSTRPSGIVLPDRQPLPPCTFGDTLTRRRSHYRFSAMSLEELAQLLGHACGAQRNVALPNGDNHIAMNAPSAGGLPSLDVYVVDLLGTTIDAGVYRYNRHDHRLDPQAAAPSVHEFGHLFTQAEFASATSTFIIIAARLDTTLVKYPARHYRTLHVDTGVLVSTLYLTSTALGLRCCAVTGFYDDAVDNLLQLPETAFTTAIIPCGAPLPD